MLDKHMRFQHPLDSRLEVSSSGFVVHVPGSEGVLLDDALLQLWQWADGRTWADLESAFLFYSEPALAEKLAVLRMAGLLLPSLDAMAQSDAPALPRPCPTLSAVIVTHNGLHHLRECLPSLAAQNYPDLQIVVVDDRSDDGTHEFLREQFPDVLLIDQRDGPNFAAGCNLGIAQATGEWIFLLNNDTVLAPDCLRQLIAAQSGHTHVAGIAAMLRFYHNRPFLNGLGNFIPAVGPGYDLGIGCLDLGQFDEIEEVPLLCFGAALLSRAALEQVGELDAAYGFYYEDADWSYRARAQGFKLLAAPRAKVYHKFSATTGVAPSVFKTRRVTRNRLRFRVKHSSLGQLVRSLLAYLWEDVGHFWQYLGQREFGLAAALVGAWGEAVLRLPEALFERARLSSKRVTTVDLEPLRAPFPVLEMRGAYPSLTAEMVEQRYLPSLAEVVPSGGRSRLLIVSPDMVGVNMGGVGMRYWELSRVLSQYATVTLAVPRETTLQAQGFAVRVYTQGKESTLRLLAADADVILLSGFIAYHHPFLKQVTQHMIIDLYDPTVLENLERFSARPAEEQLAHNRVGVLNYNELFALGDFFVCASEKQRDYWLGGLTAAGRVTPEVYAADPTLRHLIDVLPFGLQDTAPEHHHDVLKGVYPGIPADAKVILWGGGVWDWLDPLTLIKALPRVLEEVPQARLFFMGTKHPNPDVPPSQMVQRAIDCAEGLGLKDSVVFFNDWVPYAQRSNYLLEADLGLSLHGDHIETRFSFRTRLIDYLWANLPMVVSAGDVLSDLAETHGVGVAVPPGDVAAVAQAIIDLLQAPVPAARFAPLVENFRWSSVARPLVKYVAEPWRNGARDVAAFSEPAVTTTPLLQLPRKAWHAVRSKGLGGLWREMRDYIAWRLS